jgi:succinoglycan biosynthesis transport protein ExoP
MVLVQRQQISEAFVRPSVTAELETRIQTIQQEVMSRTRLSDLIVRLNLYADVRKTAPLDAVVERMRKDIQLELTGVNQPATGRLTTTAFTLSYTHRDPQTAADVANALASVYVKENTKSREQQATRTADFLETQLADVKHDLDAQDRRATEFRMQHMGELPQQVQANLASLERLNTQLRLNGEHQIRSMERRERLEKQLADAPAPPTPTAAAASAPSADVVRLSQQLADMRRQFTDRYPDVVRLQHQIAELERQSPPRRAEAGGAAAADATARLREDLNDVQAELQALKDEERSLRQAIGGHEERVENAPKRQEEFQALSRDSEATKERYNTLLQRYEEAQLAARMEQAERVEQFQILDGALAPIEPAAPNRARLLMIGVVLAIALAVGAALAAERLDTAFHSVDELRAFATVPTLVSIPLIVTVRDARRRRWRAVLTAASVVLGLALVGAGSHYVGRGNDQIARLMTRGRT